MNNSLPRAILEIDLNHLKHNSKVLQGLNAKSFFCPMVKNQAYGHGLIPVTKALLETGVKQVGVIDIKEAQELRKALGSAFDILCFAPVLDLENILWAVKNNITLVVNNIEDLNLLKSTQQKARIHLKFDTGFSRLGFLASQIPFLKDFLKSNPLIFVEALCSQLIAGLDLGDKKSYSYKQIEKLQALSLHFPNCFLHALNSEALFSVIKNKRKEFFDIGSRLGVSLYGVEPCSLESISLKKVSCLKSYVVGWRSIKKGAKVSYEGSWLASKDSLIATVSLGYGDGFLRAKNSQRDVLFRGQRAPIIGNVCMDFFMIDVTEACSSKDLTLKEEVVIFGEQQGAVISVEEQSKKAGTICYESLVALGPKVQRVYIS